MSVCKYTEVIVRIVKGAHNACYYFATKNSVQSIGSRIVVTIKEYGELKFVKRTQ